MYMLMAFFVGPLTKIFSSKTISFSSYIIIAIGCLLFGPISPIQEELVDNCSDANCVSFSQRIFAIVGLTVLGTGMGTVVTPILSELVVAIKEKMGNASKQANDKASGLFTMCSALGSILGLVIGGSLYEEVGINKTMDIYTGLCLLMAVVFFLMNIWPGFLLSPKLDEPEQELGQPINIAGGSTRMTRAIQEALEEKAHESRLVLSVRGSVAGDIIFPVTNEQKLYLAGIDEEDEEEDVSRKY